MELIELKANARSLKGKGPARVFRKDKKIPAVLYGKGVDSLLLHLELKDFENILKKGRVKQLLINLLIQNGDISNRTVMVKDIQTHPVKRNIIHIDFYEIDMNRQVRVKVPITTKGKAKGVDLGGMLQIIQRDIELSCLPQEIPAFVEVDVTELAIGDSIHVKDIILPKEIDILSDKNYTIVTVIGTKAETTTGAEAQVAEAGTEEAVTSKSVTSKSVTSKSVTSKSK